MDRQFKPGAWYSAALAGGLGEQAVLYPGSRIETHWGPIDLPVGEDVLFLHVTRVPRFMIAGKGHDTGRAWLWNGFWQDCGDTYGNAPVCFDHAGHLLISRPRNPPGYSQIDLVTGEDVFIERSIGASGIWYADKTGVWTGDETYATVEPDGELIHQFTVLGDVTIGQGHEDGAGCHLTRGTERHLIEGGNCKFIRPHRDGDQFAIPIWKESDKAAVIIRASLDELLARPRPPKPPVDVPALGRKAWLGFFTGSPGAGGGWATDTPPWTLPGNCYLSVPDDHRIYTMGGQHVATYRAAEQEGTVEALEAAVREGQKYGRPVMAYWPRNLQGGRPPVCNWLGPELYLNPGETPIGAEPRWRGLLAKMPSSQTIAFVAQCYNAPDDVLEQLVALYIRMAQADPRVIGIFPFNGSGREGGLQDRPRVRDAWQRGAIGITGMPPIQIIDPPKKPPVDPPPPPPPPPPPEDIEMPPIADPQFQEMVKKVGEIAAPLVHAAAGSIEQGARQMGDKARKPKDQGGPERNPTAQELLVGAVLRERGLNDEQVQQAFDALEPLNQEFLRR